MYLYLLSFTHYLGRYADLIYCFGMFKVFVCIYVCRVYPILSPHLFLLLLLSISIHLYQLPPLQRRWIDRLTHTSQTSNHSFIIEIPYIIIHSFIHSSIHLSTSITPTMYSATHPLPSENQQVILKTHSQRTIQSRRKLRKR